MKVRGSLSEPQFTNMGAKLPCYWDGHEGDTIPEATVQVTTLKGGAWYWQTEGQVQSSSSAPLEFCLREHQLIKQKIKKK